MDLLLILFVCLFARSDSPSALVMASSSSTSSKKLTPPWLTKVWEAAVTASQHTPPHFKVEPDFYGPSHWPVLRRIVELATGAEVLYNRDDESKPPSLKIDRESGIDREAMRSAQTAAKLMREAVNCARRVFQLLLREFKSVMTDLPESLLQFIVFVLMSTHRPKAGGLRFSLVRTEAHCKRLHSRNDKRLSPNQTNLKAQGGGRADLICSIADSKDNVVANYVLEFKSVRFRYNRHWPEKLPLSTGELKQLVIGTSDFHRSEAGHTHVWQVLAMALDQSCSYFRIEVNRESWPPADSPPVRCLAVVAVGHLLLASDPKCEGVASHIQKRRTSGRAHRDDDVEKRSTKKVKPSRKPAASATRLPRSRKSRGSK